MPIECKVMEVECSVIEKLITNTQSEDFYNKFGLE